MQLVINTFGASLRKEGDRFLAQAGAKRLAVSAHKVQSVLISTGAHICSDAIEQPSVQNLSTKETKEVASNCGHLEHLNFSRTRPRAFTECGAIMLEKRYDEQFRIVFEAIRQLMKPPEKPKGRIGFRSGALS